MSKLVMPDLIRHPVFSVDSGFRRNDEMLDIFVAGVLIERFVKAYKEEP